MTPKDKPDPLDEILEEMDGFMAGCCDDCYKPLTNAKARINSLYISREELEKLLQDRFDGSAQGDNIRNALRAEIRNKLKGDKS